MIGFSQQLKQIIRTLRNGGQLKFNIMWSAENASNIIERIELILASNELNDELKSGIRKEAMALLAEDEEKILQAEIFLALGGFCNPFYQIINLKMMESISLEGVKFSESSAFQKYKTKIARFFERLNMTVLEFDDQENIWTLIRIA